MPESDVSVLRVRASGTPQQVIGWLDRHRTQADALRERDGRVTFEVFVAAPLVQAMRDAGLAVEVLFDARVQAAARGARAGRGNRFADGRIPQGLGLRRRNRSATRRPR